MTSLTTFKSRSVGMTALAAAAGLATLAIANHVVARRAERRHPPEGSFIVVDGVRLHYSDRGEGSPVVLIHGNAVTGDDWNTSGVAELLLQTPGHHLRPSRLRIQRAPARAHVDGRSAG